MIEFSVKLSNRPGQLATLSRELAGAGVIITAVLHDKPGALADMAEALATIGVNIEAMYLLRSNGDGLHFAVAVDDPESAVDHV